MRALGAAAVALVAIILVFVSVLKHPAYTPDGIVYARFAARDAGYSERDATLGARAFYEHTAMMRNARYRTLIDLDPSVAFARSKIFENRLLYPWIVGMALPVAGFRALFLVNAAAYVAFGLALFWMLGAFRRDAVGLVLTIIVLALPLVRDAAASDLTDMPAMLWWTLALGALLRLARVPSASMLTLLAVSSALLALTRPTPYLVVLPALALGIVRAYWMPLAASLGGVAAYAIVAVLTHAYGVSEQLRWVYEHRPSASHLPFALWYRASLLGSVRYVIVETVRMVIPLVVIAGAIYGMLRANTRAQMAVLAAAAIACLVAVPFNPVPSSFGRVVLLPLIPVFCAIAQCAGEALAGISAAPSAEKSDVPAAAVASLID
jgi:hypothetical protein